MSTKRFSFLIFIVVFSSCAQQRHTGSGTDSTATQNPPWLELDSRAFFSHEVVDVCPFLHTTIKHVPIYYGLLSNRQYKELKSKIDDMELWYGGCIKRGAWAIICTQCRYHYDRSDSSWSKLSQDSSEFKLFGTPLDPFAIDLLSKCTGKDISSELWEQRISMVKKSIKESFYSISSSSILELENAFMNALNDSGIDVQFKRSSNKSSTTLFEIKGVQYELRISEGIAPPGRDVSFSEIGLLINYSPGFPIRFNK